MTPNSNAYARELNVALQVASKAGEYLRSAYDAFTPIPNAPANITTEADRASQELILTGLLAAFPNDALCAEEQTPTLAKSNRAAARVWIVDPIDGTRGFAVKNGEFSVMIGLVDNGEVVVGVVSEPAKSRITFASRGGGCWVRNEAGETAPSRVTRTTSLGAAALVQSHAKIGDTPWPVRELQPQRVVESYSAGVKLAMVARGEVDLYVNTYRNFSDWDICAGHLLVTEAGGGVTEISGAPIQYGKSGNAQQGGLLASNQLLHASAVAALNRQGSEWKANT